MSNYTAMSSLDSTKDALGLIENLKICILKQDQIIRGKNVEIASLNDAVRRLEEERTGLKQELSKLKEENVAVVNASEELLISQERSSTEEPCDRVDAPKGHTPTASPPLSPVITVTSAKGVNQKSFLSPQESPVGSPKVMRKDLGKSSVKRNDSVTKSKSFNKKYELSSDLMDRSIKVLERKYGGKEKAHHSARIIQSHYRKYAMEKRFIRLRTYSETPDKGPRAKSHSDPRQVTSPSQTTPVLRLKHKHVTDKSNRVRSILIIDNITPYSGATANLKNAFDAVETNKNSDETFNGSLPHLVSVPSEERNPVEESGDDADEKPSISETEHYVKVELMEGIGSSPGSVYAESSTKTIIANGSIPQGRITTVGEDSDDSVSEEYRRYGEGSSVDSLDGMCMSSSRLNVDQDTISMTSEFDPVPAADLKPQKLEMRIGINHFNRKPEKGINYLLKHQVLEDNPDGVAKFLLSEHGISKQRLGEYLGNLQNDFNMAVLKCFAESFDFTGMEIDVSLRLFLSQFRIPGEAQKIERLMEVFAEQYISCNPTDDDSAQDKVLILAFAIVMLNTDLHSPNVKKRMTEEEFIRNLEGTNNGGNFPVESLAGIYSRILKKEFVPARDHVTMTIKLEKKIVGKMPWATLAALHRYLRMLTPLFEVRDPNKKEKSHARVVFVFNDMLVVTKERGRAGQRDGFHFFSYKHSSLLCGVKISVFSNDYFSWGIQLYSRLQSRVVATFNATDEQSRNVFVEELLECIEETNAMEKDRISTEKQKQLAGRMIRNPGTMTLPHPKKGRVTSQPAPDTISLIDVSFTSSSLSTGNLLGSRHLSNSMLNISDADSSFSSDGGTFKRCNSSSSLDSAFVDGSDLETGVNKKNGKQKPTKKHSKDESDKKTKLQKSWLFRSSRF